MAALGLSPFPPQEAALMGVSAGEEAEAEAEVVRREFAGAQAMRHRVPQQAEHCVVVAAAGAPLPDTSATQDL